ncbi:MAG TPA: hypothetical protein VJM50_12070 [Pyrinomonadaceae bacterium]|nr:hypothetical protein [Pyrinomonadaceae bacterium]
MRIHKNVLVRSVAFALLGVGLSIAFAVRPAGASQDCQSLITALRADTEVVVLTGRQADKNRAGLLGKLDNASADLSKGKLCGAIQKLTDFRNKVNQLIASGSINTDPTVGVTGQDLVNDANEAIACIEAQVAQSGTTCPV